MAMLEVGWRREGLIIGPTTRKLVDCLLAGWLAWLVTEAAAAVAA